MPIKIDGQFNFVTIEGTQAEVSVENVRGDIIVKGGNGVTAKSIEGDVTVEGAKGRIDGELRQRGRQVSGSSGEICGGNGERTDRPVAHRGGYVEARTINGDITYEGTAVNGGRYRLTTHNGSIIVGYPSQPTRPSPSAPTTAASTATCRSRATRSTGSPAARRVLLHARERQRRIRARVVLRQHPAAKAGDY